MFFSRHSFECVCICSPACFTQPLHNQQNDKQVHKRTAEQCTLVAWYYQVRMPADTVVQRCPAVLQGSDVHAGPHQKQALADPQP